MTRALIIMLLSVVIVISGVSFYLITSGLDKMKAQSSPQENAQVKEPDKAEDQRATEKTVKIIDSALLYTINVPDSWDIHLQGKKGVRVSSITATSEDFESRVEKTEGPTNLINYEKGAQLQINVEDGVQGASSQPAGNITAKESIMVDLEEATYYEFKEPSTAKGQLLGVQFSKDGKSYLIRFGYNPQSNPLGHEIFESIIKSFRFSK